MFAPIYRKVLRMLNDFKKCTCSTPGPCLYFLR